LANQLEQSLSAPSRPVTAAAPPPVEKKRPATVEADRNSYRPMQNRPPVPQKSPPPESSDIGVYQRAPVVAPPSMPVQVVQVAPQPQIIASPRATENLPSQSGTPPTTEDQPTAESPTPAQSGQKTGFWQRLFSSPPKEGQTESPYLQNGVTPLPGAANGSGTPNSSNPSLASSKPAPVPLTHFPRYQFLSPRKPAPGDHANGTPAAGAFTRAQLFEQDERWSEALQYYEQASQADPSWFVAQYNTAVLAQRLRIYSQALAAYEYALAIQPGSTDARYNFALTLRSAGYIPDAVDELKKVLAAKADDPRPHLALGNIYAQSLHDTDLARRQYQKVLELDPDSPQASDIRFWLAANPE